MRQYCTIRRVEGKGVQCNQACGASHIAGEWGLGTEGVWPSLVCFVAARWNPVWAQIHSLAEHELVLLITLPQPLSLRITGMPTPPYLLNYLKKKTLHMQLPKKQLYSWALTSKKWEFIPAEKATHGCAQLLYLSWPRSRLPLCLSMSSQTVSYYSINNNKSIVTLGFTS